MYNTQNDQVFFLQVYPNDLTLDFHRNYGCSLFAQYEADDYGCQQVLWLYGQDHQITEAGTMNIFLHWINQDGGWSVAETVSY